MIEHRISHILTGACLLGGLLGSAPSLVLAKPTAAPREDSAVTEAKALLASGDHDKVEAGLQGLGLVGTAEACAPIVERIRDGLPPDLLDTAILTLMALGQPQAAPVLFDLTTHRRPEIRVHAIEALTAIAPKGAEEVLRAALADGDAKVRSAAAVGLGEIKATASVELLFHALDRGNMDASPAIGKILKPDQVGRLLGYLGKIPFRSLSPALAEALQRQDVSEKEKLGIVAKLQDVGTPEVKTYLGDLLHSASGSISPNLSRAILRAIQEIAN